MPSAAIFCTFVEFLARRCPEVPDVAEHVASIAVRRAGPAETRFLEREQVKRLFHRLPPKISALPVGTTARVPRPMVPLSASDLLVNARGEPGVGDGLQQEIPSADSIDVLCAFVRWNGLRLLESALQARCERGRPLRVLTTTYIGATERRALDRLERADGQSVLEWFDGRIAAELRLWDALERGLLCPFHYRNFRFDQRFRAITGGTRASLTRDIEEGFPRLPAGCVIRLDFFREAKVAAG